MGIREALRTGRNYFFVLQSGMISSAVVLLVLWAVARYWPDLHLIGWYYMVIPVGAIVAGIAAASGYVLAAMHANEPVPRWFIAPILILQLAVYVAADYAEFRRLTWEYDRPPISYVEYFDLHSRSMRLVGRHGDESSVKGYALRGMEIAGFAGPGLLVPLFMGHMPRCRKCQGYLKSQTIATILSVPETSFEDWRAAGNPEDVDIEWEARATYFEEHVTNLLRPLTDAVMAHQPEAIQIALDALRSRSDTVTAPHCLTTLGTHYCKTCLSGRLTISYRYQERGRPRFDALPSLPIEVAVLDALTAQSA